jgi:hypothetical protein
MAKKKSFVENLGMTLSQPFRVGLLGGAQELGYTIGDLIEAYQGKLDTSRPKNYWGLTEEESQRLYKDPLKTGVKSAAGVMSWAVPGGSALKGVKGVGQATLRGLGSGALSGLSYSEEGKELEGTMGGAALGGVLGGGLQAGKMALQGAANSAPKIKFKSAKPASDQATRELGLSKGAIDDLGGWAEAKKFAAEFYDDAGKGIKKANPYGRAEIHSKIVDSLDEQVQTALQETDGLINAKGILQKIKSDNALKLSGVDANDIKAIEDVLKSYTDGAGKMSPLQAHDFMKTVQRAAGGFKGVVGDQSSIKKQLLSAVRNTTRDELTNIAPKASDLLNKWSRYLATKPDMTAAIGAKATGVTVPGTFQRMGGSGLTKLMNTATYPLSSRGVSAAKAAQSAAQPVGQGLGSKVASGLGVAADVGQKAVPGIVGMSSQQPMEQDQTQLQQPVGQAEIPSDFDPIAIALQEQGFSVGQPQQPQQQFDMQKLQMDLVQAVSAGEMSTAQADWILGMMQQTYGGGEQDFASQLEQLAQVDKREASNLLARAVANGEVNTTTANTLTRLYGLSAPAQTATAALDTADLIANETEQMLEELNLGDSEVGSAIGGTFRGLYGKAIDSSKAGQYQMWIEGARTKIARALGEVGNLSEPEQIAAMKLMPTLKDTRESAANKLARFRRLIDGARRRMRGEYVPDMAPDVAVDSPSLNEDYDSWQY